MSDTADDVMKRIGLAYINLRLMSTDVQAALSKLIDMKQPAEFQFGLLMGLSGAKYVLDGKTADETWDLLKPHVDRVKKRADS